VTKLVLVVEKSRVAIATQQKPSTSYVHVGHLRESLIAIVSRTA
jgi:hypothetical protein